MLILQGGRWLVNRLEGRTRAKEIRRRLLAGKEWQGREEETDGVEGWGQGTPCDREWFLKRT